MFQEIMRSVELDSESKAIYAYLCSFAGSGSVCFPSRKLMLKELKMSETRFSKYLKPLISLGVVRVERERIGNLLGNNIYTITHEIRFIENSDTPKSLNCDTRESMNYNARELGRSHIGSSDNLSTNNNSLKSNSLNNNNINNNMVTNNNNNSQQSNQCLTANKNNKKISNSASASTESTKDINAFFEDIWKLYPNKKGKGQVSKTAKERLLKVGYEEIARAIDRYKVELEKDSDWRKPQNGSTFFNSGYVDYLDANYEPDNRPKVSNNQFNNYSGSDDKNIVNEFEKIFMQEMLATAADYGKRDTPEF